MSKRRPLNLFIIIIAASAVLFASNALSAKKTVTTNIQVSGLIKGLDLIGISSSKIHFTTFDENKTYSINTDEDITNLQVSFGIKNEKDINFATPPIFVIESFDNTIPIKIEVSKPTSTPDGEGYIYYISLTAKPLYGRIYTLQRNCIHIIDPFYLGCTY